MAKPRGKAPTNKTMFKNLKRLPYFGEETGITYGALKGMAQKGRAPFIRIGRGWYANPDEFGSWLKAQRDSSPYFAKKETSNPNR
mgnify:CR=1 FL=1